MKMMMAAMMMTSKTAMTMAAIIPPDSEVVATISSVDVVISSVGTIFDGLTGPGGEDFVVSLNGVVVSAVDTDTDFVVDNVVVVVVDVGVIVVVVVGVVVVVELVIEDGVA